jgi:hypothetical protein
MFHNSLLSARSAATMLLIAIIAGAMGSTAIAQPPKALTVVNAASGLSQ